MSPHLYEPYVPDPSLPASWIVDVDGTLALRKYPGGRDPFDMTRVGEDTPNEPVARLVAALEAQALIVVMSGRDESARADTEAWLDRHGIAWDSLHMRATGDQRKDSVVKEELFRLHVAPKHWVQGVVDDRKQVVAMWRSLGLMCAAVAEGDF
jgi:hypothetical protein